jgi:putative intracellular protease/amidase
MDIAILFYDDMAPLDAVGPWEVLQYLPGVTMHSVGVTAGPKRSEPAGLELVAAESIGEVTAPDVLVVPGGSGEEALRRDPEVLDWLRQVHATSQWTTSVCTGSLLLGAAGLLEGKRATSHWLAHDALASFGAEPTLERVVIDGKVITAAGVSSGIDMALTLAARLQGDEVAQAIQLGIEYDPQPPFDAGSPTKAPQFAVDLLRADSRFEVQGA